MYYLGDDVEKTFRDILDKYELVDKSRIIRPRPQDIGKKHYYCVKCIEDFGLRRNLKNAMADVMAENSRDIIKNFQSLIPIWYKKGKLHFGFDMIIFNVE